MTIFEEFLEYCREDNIKLSEDIKTWLSDFFDVGNRNIPLRKTETKWIKGNISKELQKEIFGEVIR